MSVEALLRRLNMEDDSIVERKEEVNIESEMENFMKGGGHLANPKILYKYAEDYIIYDFQNYVDNTYSDHYQTDKNIQCFDAWMALGDATPTFRNTALKYLWRYGKKNGNNKDDLMKVLHYTLMCLYNDHYKDGK